MYAARIGGMIGGGVWDLSFRWQGSGSFEFRINEKKQNCRASCAVLIALSKPYCSSRTYIGHCIHTAFDISFLFFLPYPTGVPYRSLSLHFPIKNKLLEVLK